MFPAFCQFHVSYDTTARPQLSAIFSHETSTSSCIEIDKAHYLVSYFVPILLDLQYISLNSPAILFVVREEGGRARLTIGPIGCIFTLAVRVARPPNAPVSMHFASTSSTVQAQVRPEANIQCFRVSTFPSRKNHAPLETRTRGRARSHEPVPPRHIPPEPVSWDNLDTRAKTSTHKGKPLGIISKGAIAPRNKAP